VAIDPVIIAFAAAGVQDVGRAFDTVEQRIVRMEQASTRAAEAGSNTRVRTAKAEGEAKVRAVGGSAQAAERAEQMHTRAAEAQAAQRLRTIQKVSITSGDLAAKLAEKEISEGRRTAREIERLEDWKMRVRIRSSEMAGRAATAEAREEAVARERFNRGIGAAGGRALRGGLVGTVGQLTGMVGTGLAIGGGFALADIAHRELSAEKQAALIVNEVTRNGKAAQGASVESILGRSSQVSKETGMAKGEVLAGTLAYTRAAKQGDFATAMENMGFFAKIAKTTGSDISEVAQGAGLLQSQNPKLKAPEMRQMLLDMMAQGHEGNIPLNEMAGLAGIVGSARGTFAGGATVNQRKLLGLTQLARSEAGGSEEAARGIKQMAIEVDKPKKAALLRSWGVKYDAQGQIESPEQLILAALKGTGGNLLQLGQVFGTRSGGLMKHLSETYRTAGGGDKGLAAASAEMASVTKATTTPQDLEAQFSQLMSTPAERFQKTLNAISEVIAMRLEPLMAKLADKLEAGGPAIERFMQSILDLAEWVIANPWKGLGDAVALSIAKELGSSVISAAAASAIKTSIGTALGSGLSIATASFAVAEVGMMIIDYLASQEVKEEKGGIATAMGGLNDASSLTAAARSGKVTPADIKKAEEEVQKLQATADQQHASAGSIRNRIFGANEWSMTTGLLGNDRSKALEGEAKTTVDAIAAMRRAIDFATKAIQAHGSAVANAPDPARHLPIASPGRS
jgi:hypothetical protein